MYTHSTFLVINNYPTFKNVAKVSPISRKSLHIVTVRRWVDWGEHDVHAALAEQLFICRRTRKTLEKGTKIQVLI